MTENSNTADAFVAANLGFERVEKFITFVREALFSVAAILFVLGFFYGQQADIATGIKVIVAILVMRFVAYLGIRYATAKREDALAAWATEASGHLVSRTLARRLLTGFMQPIAGEPWRYSAKNGRPMLEHEVSSRVTVS